MKKYIVLIGLVVLLVGCSSPESATPVPPVPILVQAVVATPTATPTLAPTITPTFVPATPTAFVTPPSPSDAAIIPILMYHHIADLPADAGELRLTWTVSPKRFDEQMNWLAQNGFHSISMAQLVAHFKQRQPLPSKPIIISFDDGWGEQYAAAFPVLKKYGLLGTFFVYTNAIDHTQFLTWVQLQEMTGAGMDIQSHSLSHPHLRDLSADAAQKEISDSKAILEKRLGKPVIAFSYPDGEYSDSIIDMLKRGGYQSAVTIAAGYRQKMDELFKLHRTRVSYNDTLDDVIKRLPK